ncbi:MAG: hypothetical protein JRG96_05470 [Deltaproteobacteria bacterium]|nr:hypothetical protein [Deltaproteobacteria bacterium]MBW2421773.1 hypothetical protein [Deltaproteobacteria bacterium]
MYLEIFLVSFAAILLEISYTRIFSFKISSYFTFLVLGFALLGTGAGGIFVALWGRLRTSLPESLLPPLLLLGAVTISLGYFVVAGIELSTYELPSSLDTAARLVVVCAVLFSNFLFVGIAIAVMIANRPENIPRLYAADLAGASAACMAVIPLLVLLTPPGCVLASAMALALASLRLAWSEQRMLAWLGGPLALVLALAAGLADRFPDPVVDPAKSMGSTQTEEWGFESVFGGWSPVFRVDVLRSPLLDGFMALAHDGDWGSALWEFDGRDETLAEMYANSSREFPFAVTREDPRILIIGSAGGNEIMASLHYGAEQITGVELNPVTVSLLREHFADYTGHIAERERVELINDEGRSFLARDPSKYDIIYFVAPDSYATMSASQASGFVLVESYLYTREMVIEALQHLRPGGVLCMQFGEVDYSRKPNRTSRYLATARSAFEELGIADFARHVLLATTVDFPIEVSTFLIKATPFSKDQVDAFVEVANKVPRTRVRHAWGVQGDRAIPNAVINAGADRLESIFESYAYEIRPVTDNAPFFWHFARFWDLIAGGNPALRESIGPEDGKGERALLLMLAVSTGFGGSVLLFTFWAVRERWDRLPRKGATAAYFALLGLGFMFYEICLIQKLTLFLGYPSYTLTVTLFALLLFSGVGSLASEHYRERRDRALLLLLAGLVGMTLFYQFGLDALVSRMIGSPLPVRIGLTVLALAPLGLCLGAFMPLGLDTVARLGEMRTEYVAWCWAVNGVFSVIASMLATILAMSFGFRILLLIALGTYLLACFTLRSVPLLPRRFPEVRPID